MTLKTPKSFMLPVPKVGESFEDWAHLFVRVLERTLLDIRVDFEQGNAVHKVVSNTAAIEDGEIVVLRDVDGNNFLCTKVSGVVKKVEIS